MKFIVNPKAGHGAAKRYRNDLENSLREKGVSHQFLETKYAGHATELARELAVSGEELVGVFGGDGTISEVANGLVFSGIRMGIIAVGTGNDFARSLSLPYNNPVAALEVVLAGHSMEVDLGCESGRYFVSTFGLGFPVVIAQAVNETRYLKGPAAFFVAVYKAIFRMRAVPMKLILDSETVDLNCTSVLIQNTEFCGGGLKMAPGARVDDGQLDIVVVKDIGKLDLMWNFPKVYRGSHLQHPRFSRFRSSAVRIECDEPLVKMFDGDIHGTTPAEVKIVPKAIRVIVPPRKAT